MAPLIKQSQGHGLQPVVCVTAQHRNILDQVVRLFDLKVDRDLDLMQPNQDLIALSSRALIGLNEVMSEVAPDVVVIQGDTTTTFLGAFVASYRKIPVAHVEAGLRSGDRHNPFPEEINRSLVGRIATWHFAPTERSRQCLLNEGIDDKTIMVTGNTIVDALKMVEQSMTEDRLNQLRHYFQSHYNVLVQGDREGSRLVLVTMHRRESFGSQLEEMCEALRELAYKHPNLQIVFPVHPNPNVTEVVNRVLSESKNVHLIQPLDYEFLVFLLMNSDLVITDSGGIQEEAPTFGVPVVVAREVTERQELIESGLGVLAGTNHKCIVESAELLLASRRKKDAPNRVNPFGDGRASERILNFISRS